MDIFLSLIFEYLTLMISIFDLDYYLYSLYLIKDKDDTLLMEYYLN